MGSGSGSCKIVLQHMHMFNYIVYLLTLVDIMIIRPIRVACNFYDLECIEFFSNIIIIILLWWRVEFFPFSLLLIQ